MNVSKTTPLNLLKIWQPRYKDHAVLIATYKVKEHNKIVFERAKHLEGREFYMSGKNIRSYPKDTNGKISVYVVPLDDLEVLEYKEDIAKQAIDMFDK